MTPWLSCAARCLIFRSAEVGGMDPAGPQVNNTATAGVIARPPLLFLAALLLGFVSDRLLPSPFTVPGGLRAVASPFIFIGLALAAAGIRNFSRAATPVPTNQPKRALVTTGISRLEPQSHLSRPVSRLRRQRVIRAQPMGADPHAAACHHDPLRRLVARG